MLDFDTYYFQKLKTFDFYVAHYLDKLRAHAENKPIQNLISSMRYSLESGGKRFRPVLSLITAEALNISEQLILPFALSLEMIHTYSLIHDDLPSMDNDDFRRGKPTNHKVYGEAFALLSGDALLTESFLLLSTATEYTAEQSVSLIKLLSKSSGTFGMVGGQAIDLYSVSEKNPEITIDSLNQLHFLKTGALISAAATGPGILTDLTDENLNNLAEFGRLLGLAFQIADDLHDKNNESEVGKNFVHLIGEENTIAYLREISNQATNHLAFITDSSRLKELVNFNLQRQN